MSVQDALDYETLGFITNFETFSMVALRGQNALRLMEKLANIRFLRNRAKHNGCSIKNNWNRKKSSKRKTWTSAEIVNSIIWIMWLKHRLLCIYFLPHTTSESYAVFKCVRAILCMFWFLPQSFRHIILSIKHFPRVFWDDILFS